MNPVLGSRRRADEFDLLLSRSASEASDVDAADAARYGDLLELVTSLRATSAPLPSADFSAGLRSRLMVAAESAFASDGAEQSTATRRTPNPRRSPRERRVVAAVGGFAIVSATASMAVAAQSALPGDTLYPLKRAIENAQTGVQRDADGKGTTLLGNAAGRLDEVDALSRSGDDSSAIATTLEDFVSQASEASALLLSDYSSTGHASSIEELRSFTADSMGALTKLQSLIPKDARASLIEATQIITAIDVQAQSLCPACTSLPIMQAPVFAQKGITALLDDALSPVLSTTPPSGKTPTNTAPSKGGRNNGGSKGGPASPDASSSPLQPNVPDQTPIQPTLPQGSGDKDPKGGKKGAGGLIDDLNVSNSDDPIGDLLTGTGEVLDEVVDGVVGGLSGLGGN